MGDSLATNRRIAKNTLMLYTRMLLIMVVSLYTSRVVLNTLGIEDYGIYNVVAGFVAMFGFMNNAMTSATQRFLSYELGLQNSNQIRNVFQMSLNIHLIMAIAVFLIAETLGLWYIRNKLVIPEGRELATVWVFRFSIYTLFLNIISVPYSSMIIAYERMRVFAGIGILEVCLKLLIVFILQWYGSDKLIFYAILTFCVAIIVRFFYGYYCNRKIQTTTFRFFWNNTLFKNMFNHVGWMFIGTSSQMLSYQGVNMLLNAFFGVTVNAARGVAFQVRGAVHSFVTNFMIAVRPQIIKSYAKGNYKEMNDLVFMAAKFSFYVLFYMSLPVLLMTETILQWWLKIIPENAIIFTRLIIIDLFFTVLFTSITTISQASNRIKIYQIVVSAGFILGFIFSYILFKFGFPSYSAFIVMIFMSFISLLARLYVLKSQLSFPMNSFLVNVFFRCVGVALLSLPIPLWLTTLITDRTLQFFIVTLSTILSSTVVIWFVGVTKTEKFFIKNTVTKIISKFI